MARTKEANSCHPELFQIISRLVQGGMRLLGVARSLNMLPATVRTVTRWS